MQRSNDLFPLTHDQYWELWEEINGLRKFRYWTGFIGIVVGIAFVWGAVAYAARNMHPKPIPSGDVRSYDCP